MKIVLITNPYSGKAKNRKLIPTVEKKLHQNKIRFDLFVTRYHEHAMDIVKQISVREYDVDVCRFTQNGEVYYFVNLMGLGFVTDVAGTAARFRRTGDFSYVIGVFLHTLGLRFHEMVLEIDGQIMAVKNCFVEICNSRYTGGDMLMAPQAIIDDGLFDAVILSPLSRTGLISTFPKIFKGAHGQNPAVRFVRGKSATIRTRPEKAL
ncbi:MAG: diacylglycerol/lipid kinase family protein, partial [Planctomycetota bacterium]